MTETANTVAIINTEIAAIPELGTSVLESGGGVSPDEEWSEESSVDVRLHAYGTIGSFSGEQRNESSQEFSQLNSNITHNITFRHTIENVSFGNLPPSVMTEIFKDGRAFSHFIEAWLAITYPLTHIKRCKQYDHTDVNDETVKYDQKTFTKRGCKYMPSNMIGEGRTFNQEIFKKKANQLIYIIVSNVHFPEIMVRFVKGCDLIVDYPTGNIPFKDFDKFFN